MTAAVQLQRTGRVTLLELNRPEALNAIDVDMRRALAAELDAIGRDPDTGAVVLAGAGRGFCAGADLKGGSAGTDPTLRSTARVLMHGFHPVLESITRIDKPVIAAIHGGAVGVGMSLALACDLVVMAEDAFMLSSFINVGLIPDSGVAWFLLRRIGYARTFEVLADAGRLDAQRCLELGLANRRVEPQALRENALQWAEKLAARAPMALALTKRMARLAQTASLSDALAMEAELQTLCMATEDSREAMAAFAEKRPPQFKGR